MENTDNWPPPMTDEEREFWAEMPADDEIDWRLYYKEQKEALDIVYAQDEDFFRKFFVPAFNGGFGNSDNFTLCFLPALRVAQNDKAIARLAYMIYDSKKFTKKAEYKSFKEWYEYFCLIKGCKYHKDYKPNKLKPISKEEIALADALASKVP